MIPSANDHTGISFAGELRRKALHLLALALPLAVLYLGRDRAVDILIPLTVLMLAADILRVRWRWLNVFVQMVFGPMMRKSELPPTGSPVVLNGATWTMVSITVLTVLFPVSLVVVAFGMAMLGDAAAALFGRSFGKHPWGRKGCTLEGSGAYLIAALGTGLAITGLAITEVQIAGIPSENMIIFVSLLVAGGAATIVEALPLPGNDNLNAPLAAAIVLYLIAGTLPLNNFLVQIYS